MLLCVVVCVAMPARAADRFLLIAGTVGQFHTDARILNPSFDKDITVSATLLPTGNIDNSGETAVTFTVARRQVRAVDDIVETLFKRGVLGAIKLSSDDPFEAHSRIYAKTLEGTQSLGVPGLPIDAALDKGALVQLKSAGSGFRTNLGAVNPNATPADVTWTLYDRDNRVAGRRTITMAPFGVVGPTPMSSGTFFPAAAGADLTEAWASYSTATDTPIFAYASIVDNSTASQTLIPAVRDRGTPPPPVTKIIDVSLQNFYITFSPALSDLHVGDRVVFRLLNRGGMHGWRILDPDGKLVTEPVVGMLPENQVVERSFVVNAAGVHLYQCSNNCGSGHTSMRGTFTTQPGQ
jgi:plastocyanin